MSRRQRPSAAGRPTRRAFTAMASVTGLTAAASLSTFALTPHASAAQQPPTIDCPQVKQAPILADDYNPNGRNFTLKPDRRGGYVPVIMVPDWSGRATHDESRTGDFSVKIDLGTAGPLPDPVLPLPGTVEGEGEEGKATPTPTPTPTPKPAKGKKGAKAAASATPTAPAVVLPDGRASLIGQIQRVPGAVVYTFDYRDNAGRWVDDPGIGPALGDAIDCVSAALGQKVILVTKGVGGLAARYATAGLTDDHTRADKVSTVINYGSPQTGSLMAELLSKGIGKTASEPRMLLRLLLASCAAVPRTDLPLDAPCSYLPYLAKLMSGADGLALRTGSSQLTDLRPFPPTVAVHSFAGEATFASSQLGWFGLRPFRSLQVSLGDLVAQASSTTAGATTQLRAACNVQLDAFGQATQSAGLRIATVGLPPSQVPKAWPAWYSTARPCFNGSLTRIQEFATDLAEIIRKEIRNRQPITQAELEALPVPALCDHPAGRLVGGYLPNIPEGEGYVALASKVVPEHSDQLTVFGDITGDGVADTVVVMRCANAAGRGSDAIVPYDSQGRMLGAVVLQNVSKQVYNDVYEIIVRGGEVRMRWATTRDTDDPCCPTLDAGATFRYDSVKGVIVPGPKINVFNETQPAQLLVTAVKAGKRGRAMQYASAEIVDKMIEADTVYGGLGAATCYGATYHDSTWPSEAREEYGDWPPVGDGVEHGDRFCILRLDDRPVALLGLKHKGFRKWEAVEFRIPEGSPIVSGDDEDDDGSILPPVLGADDEPTPEPEDETGGGPLFP